MQNIYRIEFHSPLFHAGKNFTNKVEVHRIPGLEIKYDEAPRLFYVEYLGRTAVIPESSAFLWEFTPEKPPAEVVNEHKTHDVGKIKSAQVSSPMGHVFEGPGAGKARDKK